jgi:hypothetical protein
VALKIKEATEARPEIRGDIAVNSCVAKAPVPVSKGQATASPSELRVRDPHCCNARMKLGKPRYFST